MQIAIGDKVMVKGDSYSSYEAKIVAIAMKDNQITEVKVKPRWLWARWVYPYRIESMIQKCDTKGKEQNDKINL